MKLTTEQERAAMSDHAIIEAMRRFGGSFAAAIADAASKADASNFARLRAAFPELWEEYQAAAAILHQQGRGPA